jgi:NADH-quinone oxidoreductase subunit N
LDQFVLGIIPGVVFMLSGLFFKMYAFPFHAWVPDVYEGSPVTTGLFFASVPKLAVVGLISRLVFGPFYSL